MYNILHVFSATELDTLKWLTGKFHINASFTTIVLKQEIAAKAPSQSKVMLVNEVWTERSPGPMALLWKRCPSAGLCPVPAPGSGSHPEAPHTQPVCIRLPTRRGSTLLDKDPFFPVARRSRGGTVDA